MRQPLVARLFISMMMVLAGTLVAAASAAPLAQPPEPEQSQPQARIAVVHAAPFAADSTVTVVANGILLDNDFDFGERISYVSVPAGSYDIEIYAGSLTPGEIENETPLHTESITLDEGIDYTAIAVGTNSGDYPLDLLLLDDTTEPPASATAKLRVVHAAPFAPTVDATAVDIIPDAGGDSIIPSALEPFTYGKSSDFITLPSGESINLKIVPDGDPNTTLLDLPEMIFEAGEIVTVIYVGGANGHQQNTIVVPFSERGPAYVRLVHAAPFAAGDATVTVALNDQVLTTSLNHREVTPYLRVAPGSYNVAVFIGTAATGAPTVNAPLLLRDGERYTLVLIGTNSSDYPLNLVALSDDRTPSASATARVRVLHAAPFAATPAGSAVDVLIQDGTPIPDLDNIVYGEVRENINVPSGIPFDLKVVPAGQPNATPIIDPGPLTFAAGGGYTVIAVSGPEGQEGDLLLLDDLAEAHYLFVPMAAQE